VAKTVFSDGFEKAQVAIFEMGARQEGDIKELCELVKPDYILFPGVCAQHIQTFGSKEAVFRAKCEALFSTAKTVICGKGLEDRIAKTYPEQAAKCVFASEGKGVELRATETAFTLVLEGGEVAVKTALLGEGAVENISLAACLAEKLGLTQDEIARGAEKLQPVEHRLALSQENGVYILDDAYNCNIKGAKAAIAALGRFEKSKYVITPGIVETGVLHSEINGELGCVLAGAGIDLTVLVGETQARVIEKAYLQAGGAADRLIIVPSLERAVEAIQGRLAAGDCILFMNDLPDVV
jgi:UDP-N-acetylmuramoyl-tripeptide--D-alanyl-D-alanine ligase